MNRKLFDAQIAQYDTPTVSNEGSIKLEDNIRCYLPYLKIDGNTFQQAYKGKNLLNVDKFLELILTYNSAAEIVEVDGRRCIKFTNSALNDKDFTSCCPKFKENTRYICSFYARPYSVGTSTNTDDLYFRYKNVTYTELIGTYRLKADTVTDFTRMYVINNANTSITDLNFSYGYVCTWLIDLDTIYLYEYENNSNPVYEPYVGGIPSPHPGQVTGTPASPVITVTDIYKDSMYDTSEWTAVAINEIALPEQGKTYRIWVDKEQFEAQTSTFAYLEIYIGTSLEQILSGSDGNGVSQLLAKREYAQCTFNTIDISENFYIGVGNTYDSSGISGFADIYWEALKNIGVYIQTEPYESTLVEIPAYPQLIQSVGDFASDDGENTVQPTNKNKNLFDVSKAENGSIASADGSNLNTSTNRARTPFIYLTKGTYTISMKEAIRSNNMHFYSKPYASDWLKTYVVTYTKSNGRHYATFSVEQDCYFRCAFAPVSGSSITDLSAETLAPYDVMIEKGDTMTEYEPYFSGDSTNNVQLPSDYQELEYIQSTGTQYINTGVFASENNSFEVKAQLVHTDTASQTIWGGRQSSSVMQSNQLSCTKSAAAYQFACGNTTSVSKPIDTNLHVFKAEKNILYIDGELVYTVTSATITYQNSVYLFATNTAGTIDFHGGSLKMYYCKIWNGDTLVRDFIPCYRRSDNAVGMYDLVGNKFYANVGTGEFVKGDNILKLPSEYQEVEYMESTGTQYINTGVVPNNETGFSIDVSFPDVTTDMFRFGCRKDSGATRFVMGTATSHLYFGYGVTINNDKWAINKNEFYNAKLNFLNSRVANLNDKNDVALGNLGVDDMVYSIIMFGRNSGGSISSSAQKIKACKISQGTEIIRDFIPCYRKSDNELGMYDLINNKFYTNQGTGSFKSPGVLSNEYQEVEYIESTGTQYIDTGFKPNQDTRVVCDFQLTEVYASFVFGGRDSSTAANPKTFTFNMGGGSPPKFVTTYGTGGQKIFKNADLLRHVVDKNKNKTTFDDVSLEETYSEFTSPRTLALFACNQTANYGYLPSKMKLYSCQIYDNDVLIRDFIPCYRKSDGVIGLYDSINNVFYVNVGTGEFIKGDDIKNETNIENKIIVEFRGKNLFNINNYTPLTNPDSTITLGFDISNLVIGEKYIFTSNLPITWFKISNHKSGNNSVQYNSNSGFTKFSFTMSRHANISEDKTQYLILATTGLNAISDISELDGYNIQIEQVSTSGINLLNTQYTLDRSYGISSITNNKITVNKLYGDATNYLVYSKVYKAGTYAISAKKTSSSGSYVRLLTTSQISGSTYNSYYKAYYSTFITSDKDSAIISFTSNSDFQIGFNFNGTKDTSIEIYDIRLCKMDLKYEPYVEPISIGIPTSITVGSSVVPLRFAKVDKSDYLEVDRANGTVKYINNIAYWKMPHAASVYSYSNGYYYGVGFGFVLDYNVNRAKGFCTHTNKVGDYYPTYQEYNAIWLGVNSNKQAFWIGIQKALGIDSSLPKEEQVSLFNAWLDEQEAQGTPVELIYEMKAPITYDLTNTDFGQELLNFATKNGANIFEIKTDVKPTLTAKYLTHK